jgi:hypothetical protein
MFYAVIPGLDPGISLQLRGRARSNLMPRPSIDPSWPGICLQATNHTQPHDAALRHLIPSPLAGEGQGEGVLMLPGCRRRTLDVGRHARI